MLKSLVLIVGIGVTSFYFTELSSESILLSLVLPILDLVALIALAIWLVLLFHNLGVNQYTRPGDGGDFDGFDGGGDGGC